MDQRSIQRRNVHMQMKLADALRRELAIAGASPNDYQDLAFMMLVDEDGHIATRNGYTPQGLRPALRPYAKRRYSAITGERMADASLFSRWSQSAEAADLQKHIPSAKVLVIGGGVATATILGIVALWKVTQKVVASVGDGSIAPTPHTGTLAGCLVGKALELLPTPTSILGSGDDRWNAALGGLRSPGKWGLYENGFGTTCGIFVAYLLSLCHGPATMIDRSEADGGSGFEIGAHIAKLYSGAKGESWLMLPQGGHAVLQPGDITCTHNPGAPPGTSGEHVELVIAATSLATGGQTIEAAAGGQVDSAGRQCAKRVTRTLVGTTMTRAGVGSTQLAWWIRPR